MRSGNAARFNPADDNQASAAYSEAVREAAARGKTGGAERAKLKADIKRQLLKQARQAVLENEVRAELAAERAPKPYDFGPLIRGEATRPEPEFFPRDDGQYLIYPGREHAFIGETESGKDMLLICGVQEMLEADCTVAWTDFEESDGIDTGSRFMNAGLDPKILCDKSRFRHYAPGTPEDAESALRDIVKWAPDLAIYNGVTAAYQLFGWQVKEGGNAADYRAALVRPCLDADIAVISTDHVTMDNAQGKGVTRYAYGGVMKLNLSNGATYLLVNSRAIVHGEEGASRIYVVKDRPGSVKPNCEKDGKDPMIRYAGMLIVKSSGLEAGELKISITAPDGNAASEGQQSGANVPDWLMERVISDWKEYGDIGMAKSAYVRAWKGDGARELPLAIETAVADGYLVQGKKSTHGYKLVHAKAWDGGMRAAQPKRRMNDNNNNE